MNVVFSKVAFADYRSWSRDDARIFGKINDLLKDIARSPFSGLGKPEPLKHELSGYWSRRITKEHRLVYKITDETIFVLSCKYHY